jgi:repressor LexA
MGEIRLLGLVEAGFPTAAEENELDTMSIDDYLIQNRDATFMLRVKGDSMKDAGIVEGDMVIVERTQSPKVGQIVVADVDGSWTMKYLRKAKSGEYYLEAANDAYPDIYPEGELQIAAVVRGVVRKYG